MWDVSINRNLIIESIVDAFTYSDHVAELSYGISALNLSVSLLELGSYIALYKTDSQKLRLTTIIAFYADVVHRVRCGVKRILSIRLTSIRRVTCMYNTSVIA